jgi:hypothetical protein
MKKVVFFFCFVLVITLPNSSFGKKMNTLSKFHISQNKTNSTKSFIQENNFYNDDYLIGEADEDINENERKSFSLQKANFKTFSFKAENYIATIFKKNWSNKYFFHLHHSLFIFISVFRL